MEANEIGYVLLATLVLVTLGLVVYRIKKENKSQAVEEVDNVVKTQPRDSKGRFVKRSNTARGSQF